MAVRVTPIHVPDSTTVLDYCSTCLCLCAYCRVKMHAANPPLICYLVSITSLLHNITEFDGKKRSCRMKLERHKVRARRVRAAQLNKAEDPPPQ